MARRSQPRKESIPPRISAAQAIPLIRQQIERLDHEIIKLSYKDPKIDGWESTTQEILNAVFGLPDGELHLRTQEFSYAQSGEPLYVNMGDHEIQRSHELKQQKRKALLEAYIEQLQVLVPLGSPQEAESTPDSLELVKFICARFHLVARQLRDRHDSRQTLIVADEYDVQDLLHSLLRLHFDDIRPEEWTPSYAGGTSRMDFLLKAEQLVIETKMTRPNRTGREISEELIIDIARYRSHPDCKTLVCFVYDPLGVINNPRGVEKDLDRLSGPGLQVVTIISP